MRDYSKYGLTYNLRATDGPSAKRADFLDRLQSGEEIEVTKVNSSKINLGEFIKYSSGETAQGTFNLSQALTLTSTITYRSPKARNRTFGKPVIGVFQGAGTASADMIYPVRGASVTLGRYDVIGGEADYSHYNGTADEWRAVIVDTNGTSTQEITFVADWLFTDYVTDDVS